MCVFGALAQLVVRYIRIVEVTGSTPVCSTLVNMFERFHRPVGDETVLFLQKAALSKINLKQ